MRFFETLKRTRLKARLRMMLIALAAILSITKGALADDIGKLIKTGKGLKNQKFTEQTLDTYSQRVKNTLPKLVKIEKNQPKLDKSIALSILDQIKTGLEKLGDTTSGTIVVRINTDRLVLKGMTISKERIEEVRRKGDFKFQLFELFKEILWIVRSKNVVFEGFEDYGKIKKYIENMKL